MPHAAFRQTDSSISQIFFISNNNVNRFYHLNFLLALAFWLAAGANVRADADAPAAAGFLFDSFSLVLEPGQRTEAVGPFYYSEKKEDEATLAIPPLISFYENSVIKSGKLDFFYPLLTYQYYTDEWRLQLFNS